MTVPTDRCALSVVIGSIACSRSIERCVASIEAACKGLDSEIIVVTVAADEADEGVATVARRPGVRVQTLAPPALMPHLWAAGLAISRGQVVAFTTGHFEVSESWARGLLGGIERGATGVAGSLSLAPETRPVDWAVFYLRYSPFLEDIPSDRDVADIPGDNAAYRRDALDRHSTSFADGFWEVDFHRRIRAEGARLALVPAAGTRFRPFASLRAFARQRFEHGCQFGGWRVKFHGRPAWLIAVAAPAVPFVLVGRIARRVLRRPSERMRFIGALPALMTLATAWAAGEAWGALFHRPSPPVASNPVTSA